MSENSAGSSRRRFLEMIGASAVPLSRLGQGEESAAPAEVPWLAEVQREPDKKPKQTVELSPLLVDDAGQPITTREAWQEKRRGIRRAWLEFLGELKVQPRVAPKGASALFGVPRLEVIEEDRPEGCVRQRVRYDTEPGLAVEGYLLKPDKLTGRRPGVVALHSTVNCTIRQPAGLEGEPGLFFGLQLARRGCVAFCPTCFLWVGEGSYDEKVIRFQKRHPGCKGMAKMLWDAMRAVDVLAGLEEVDPKRLGAVGHSLGGKEVLYLAAFDERIKAAVSSEGGIGIAFSNWDAPWYLGKEAAAKTFRREHHELLALAAPRAFLLVGGESADGDSSWPFVQAAMSVYRLYGQPCRLGLLNHRGGHCVPPQTEQRIHDWLISYL
ncbi:MAG: acetylxylan esterase [Planctomycetota bacterium]|nr:acetylxylan esterase [Planctomycetota bacterium]